MIHQVCSSDMLCSWVAYRCALQAKDVSDVPKALIATIGLNAFIYTLVALSLAFIVTSDELLTCVTSVGDPVEPQPATCLRPNLVAYQYGFVYAFNLQGMLY